MKRLLIVTAHMPPTNAVDMHRVRLSLPHYRRFGYEPTVLCFEHGSTQHPEDPLLCRTLPSDVHIERVQSRPNSWTRWIGLNAVGFRGFPAMRRALLKAAANIRPDVVLFSTTSFPLMNLGPLIQRTADAPFVLDFQDPWVDREAATKPVKLKHQLVAGLHRYLEARTVPHAGGLMAVSGDYLASLSGAYPAVADLPQDVIPFPSADQDVEFARRRNVSDVLNESPLRSLTELQQDLSTRFVGLYAGAYVETMQPMLRALFAAIRQLIVELPESADRLRLWFVGSNYSASDSTRRIEILARECGVEALVRESPARVPYFDVLTLSSHSAFNLLLGSTSRGYNPSKLFTLLHAGRPVLGLVQPGTQAEATLQQAGGTATVSVDHTGAAPASEAVLREFLTGVVGGRPAVPPLNEPYLEQFTAASLTERQADLFDRVLEHARRGAKPAVVSR